MTFPFKDRPLITVCKHLAIDNHAEICKKNIKGEMPMSGLCLECQLGIYSVFIAFAE